MNGKMHAKQGGERTCVASVREQGRGACKDRVHIASMHGKGAWARPGGMHTKVGWAVPGHRGAGPGEGGTVQGQRTCKGGVGIASGHTKAGWALPVHTGAGPGGAHGKRRWVGPGGAQRWGRHCQHSTKGWAV